MYDQFNVASATGLPGPVADLWQRFARAGFAVGDLPDDCGWMRSAVFSGYVVGRIGVRDELGRMVERQVGRTLPYTSQQKRNLMGEANVLAHCSWPVDSVPAIPCRLLETLALNLVSLTPRRNRRT